jgi:glycosyltransferase involved in cell wall biosynthesis
LESVGWTPASARRAARTEGEMALTDPATLSPVRPSEPRAADSLALSAAIICLNEAVCIGKCLESLRDCAEIVVVDSGSTDGTLAIVESFARRGFPIRLIHQPWLGYARQKQLALDLTTCPWVLSVDADEWLDEDLRASLPRLMGADDSVAGWKVRRSLTLYGQAKPVSRWTRPEHILRLARRGRARFDPALIVHEGLVADHGETPIARDGLLRHERSLPLNEQMKKEIVYARLKAEQRLKQGRKPSMLKLVFNPPIYFLRIFFWNRFFLCGWAGFIHAATGAMYSLMTEAIHRQLYRARAER